MQVPKIYGIPPNQPRVKKISAIPESVTSCTSCPSELRVQTFPSPCPKGLDKALRIKPPPSSVRTLKLVSSSKLEIVETLPEIASANGSICDSGTIQIAATTTNTIKFTRALEFIDEIILINPIIHPPQDDLTSDSKNDK